ncbi:MAG: hypothetical protein IKW59_05555 [Clostridia bacterium]|nr:hypothetical protein [Clostridia bacterium]
MIKTKKIKMLSLLLSVLLLFSVLFPIMSTALAVTEAAELLNNFTDEELETTYTYKAPYKTVNGLTAPCTANLNATLHSDAAVGDFLRLKSIDATDKAVFGGLTLYNEELNLGNGENLNNMLTLKTAFRSSGTSPDDQIYWWLTDSDGNSSYYIARLWGSAMLYNGQNKRFTSGLEHNVWYTITLTCDLSTGYSKVIIDGGDYKSVAYSIITDECTPAANGVVYTKLQVGTARANSGTEQFDFADIALTNTGSFDYDSVLDFESTSLKSGLTSWSEGQWSSPSDRISTWKDNMFVEDSGDASHKKVLKLTTGETNHLYIDNTLPTDTIGANDVLVIEGSYTEDLYSQFGVNIEGKSNGDTIKKAVLSNISTSSWKLNFLGMETDDSGNPLSAFIRQTNEWIDVKIVLDLANDKATLTYYKESDPTNVITATNTTALADVTSISLVRYKFLTKWDGTEYVDDLRVYKKSDLRYVGSVPSAAQLKNALRVEKPALLFNMPLADKSLDSVKLNLKDSKGTDIKGSIALNERRTGIVFYPEENLNNNESYVMSASGTVTDIFGQTLKIDKEISFSVNDKIHINSCEFYQNNEKVDKLTFGELTAKINLETYNERNDILLLMCLYSEYGSLYDISIEQMSQTLENELITEINIPNDGEKYNVKIFVWDTLETLRPYMHPMGGDIKMELVNYNEARVETVEKVRVTDEQVEERMAGKILFTTESSKALVNNEIVPLDSANPDFTSEVIDDTAMIPLDFVAKQLGIAAKYENGKMTVSTGSKESIINKEETAYTSDGKTYTLKVAPKEKDGHLLVPVEAVKTIFEKDVFYDSCGYVIIGDGAESFDVSDEFDKKLLDKAVRNVLFDTASGSEIISMLTKNHPEKSHPRLMITKDSLPQLRNKVKTDAKCIKWMEDLLKLCDEYLKAEPLKWGRTDGIRMLVTSRKACDYIWNLSFAYLATGDEKYAEGARQVLLNVCGDNFPDWNPYHWLDVAEMTAAVGFGYDWCYDYLSDADKKIIIDGVTEKGLKPGLDELDLKEGIVHSSGYWANPNGHIYPSNWVSVCSGSLILGALAVADESEELKVLTGDILSKCLEKEKDMVAAFSPDGAWKEGPTYWRYAYKYLSFAIDSLTTALGTDFGLTKSPGLHHGAYFMIGMTASVANFDLANSDYNAIDCPQFMWLSKCYEDKALARYRTWFLEEYKYRAGFNDIIWYVPEYAGELDSIPTETNTRISPIATTRTGYGKEEFYVGFHGADDGGGRVVDMDAGTYIIDLFGKRWIVDSGTEGDTYSSHEGVKLRDYYRMRAEGHNTIVVNPGYYEDQNYYALKDIEEYKYNDRYTFMKTDFTNVYAFKGVKSFKRAVTADKTAMSTRVQDEIKFIVPSELYSFVHLGGTAEIAPDGRSAVIVMDNNKMSVQLVGDESLKLEKMNAVPLETSPNTLALGAGQDDSHRWKLVIHSEKVMSAEYALIFTPLCGDEEVKPAEKLKISTA